MQADSLPAEPQGKPKNIGVGGLPPGDLLDPGIELISFRMDWLALQIQPVHPKGDQSPVFTGRTDDEAETPILWPPHSKS